MRIRVTVTINGVTRSASWQRNYGELPDPYDAETWVKQEAARCYVRARVETMKKLPPEPK
jgi:hypothetical protein